ncbi:hypothetical protein [Cernens ardua]|uniref:hypothetical protein n=1 Tax=Cernens ardua TaxID=3402176 RepID=UPI003F9E2AD1
MLRQCLSSFTALLRRLLPRRTHSIRQLQRGTCHYNDCSGSRLRYVIAGKAGASQNVRELKATYATQADATHAAEAE